MQPTTVSVHLIAASDLVHATARATVRAIPCPRDTLAHIDAAQSFMIAAGALYDAAEWIAAGKSIEGAEMKLALWLADAKVVEGRGRIAGTWNEYPLS